MSSDELLPEVLWQDFFDSPTSDDSIDYTYSNKESTVIEDLPTHKDCTIPHRIVQHNYSDDDDPTWVCSSQSNRYTYPVNITTNKLLNNIKKWFIAGNMMDTLFLNTFNSWSKNVSVTYINKGSNCVTFVCHHRKTKSYTIYANGIITGDHDTVYTCIDPAYMFEHGALIPGEMFSSYFIPYCALKEEYFSDAIKNIHIYSVLPTIKKK